MLFLRAFKSLGRHFAIILGIFGKVFSFLMILFITILGFSHAFYILLKPIQEDYTLDIPNFIDNDPNSPWNLASKYFTYFESNNSYNQNSIMVQQPNGNTNMFAHFHSSMLAMYNFLAGDNGAFESWQLQDEPYLAMLFVVFSFVVVIYLMNLFIAVLNNQIEDYDIDGAFLAQKANIIKEIELFYLLPNQRRWREWFPDTLSYYEPIEDIQKKTRKFDNQKKIREIDSSGKGPEFLPFISEELRKLANIPKPDNLDVKQVEKDLRNDLEEIKDKLNLFKNLTN
ncbi:2135_t:CDS:2 [Entrophospora sp. SA101]|nr:2135_t:CDS:2 [Entrophospora sp. SA101]